jgi:hypothetical protein
VAVQPAQSLGHCGDPSPQAAFVTHRSAILRVRGLRIEHLEHGKLQGGTSGLHLVSQPGVELHIAVHGVHGEYFCLQHLFERPPQPPNELVRCAPSTGSPHETTRRPSMAPTLAPGHAASRCMGQEALLRRWHGQNVEPAVDAGGPTRKMGSEPFKGIMGRAVLVGRCPRSVVRHADDLMQEVEQVESDNGGSRWALGCTVPACGGRSGWCWCKPAPTTCPS